MSGAPEPTAETGPRCAWVLIEQQGGRVHPVSWELLGAARRLAAELDADRAIVEAVLLGQDVGAIAQEALRYGARRVHLIEDPVLADYRNLPYAVGISRLVQAHRPEIFLIGATSLGRDLASAVATRVETGLTADCTELTIDPKLQILAATRPTFGGNLMATILCRWHRPQMATVRPRVLPLPEPLPPAEIRGETRGEVVRAPLGLVEAEVPLRRLRLIRGAERVDLEYAEVIVAGGRGLGDRDGLPLLRQLAEALGGVLAVSRPLVDAGWVSVEHQVGQTGKTVRPKLYVAAGISGAVQHRVGMSGAGFILAINKDPHAPIFQIADLGIVGDLYEVVPALIDDLRARRSGGDDGR
ncbi:electron transfer flavoprotein subunit alpha/FixB family protein [Thiococcus pfennigii]|uniref:electron transfer flavoprotein subunit alpha/FixB family protein n=1 Tax=Thiococcus pfennigii TaxID=1057 RepID=UPI001905CCEA|nr:electron transfer flavoprotein subunit alpha/FixB family protein [Thiococcus pfennigii]MBK1700107.1 electron transfer flavoprotein subunit alpha [Thiococcus pfennigii]